MHRHGYIGRKFGREKDQRNALKRGLMISLVKEKSVRTTLPKAKEIRRPMEKLITVARKGDLASRRRVMAILGDIDIANQLVDEIAPKIKRDSGYLRVVKLDENRVGDNAPMAKIEFVDEFKQEEPVKEEEKQPAKATKEPAKRKAEAKTTVKKVSAK